MELLYRACLLAYPPVFRRQYGDAKGQVVRMVIGEVMVVVGVALVIGLGGAMLVGPGVAAVLFGVSPADPLTLLATAALLALTAAVATWLPTRRGRCRPGEGAPIGVILKRSPRQESLRVNLSCLRTAPRPRTSMRLIPGRHTEYGTSRTYRQRLEACVPTVGPEVGFSRVSFTRTSIGSSPPARAGS